ncbi:methyl-accepting chemotaxis protein [Roseateles sp. BYS87W]|uniref:Methyl-accepting chemotaxis protein n=1 Tax=Pelomonas baiyunensis TaxID=3299026 RepID=A0ABW7H2Q0_9BURK
MNVSLAPGATRAAAASAPTAARSRGDFFRYHGWLAPGIRLFRRLSFTAKALWIATAFVVPLVVMLAFLWQAAQGVIGAAQAEQQGVAYLRPTLALMRAAQDARASAMLGESPADALRRAEQALSKLDAAEREMGQALGTRKAFDQVRQRHAALRDAPLDASALPAYVQFNDAVLALITDVADGSQLSLDPDLDTYHMMLVTVMHGPLQTEILARLRDLGSAVLKAGAATPEQHDQISKWSALQSYMEANVERSFQLGVAAFPEVAKPMDMAGADAAQEAFLKAVETQLLSGSVQGDGGALKQLGNAVVERQHRLNDQVLERLTTRLQERIDEQQHGFAFKLMLSGAFVAVAAYLLLSFYRVMMGGLDEVADHLKAITQGNLTTAPRPWGRDEAASLMLTMGEMQTALRSIVGEVLRGSAQVRTSSQEIAGASLDLSARTEQTAANLEETAATMEQISAQVQHAGRTVEQANGLMKDNARAAGDCGQAIGDVVQTMATIRQSSARIGEIIGVIDGIAFQTNILALNAAVEAARAGEHGRGFAVVASEVRALASRSAEAAKEIKTLIGTSMDQVEAGHGVVGRAQGMMVSIVDKAGQMATMMDEIALITQQQGQGVVEVGQAVRALDTATQQNAALVEETSAAAKALSEQAQRLSEEISYFKLS